MEYVEETLLSKQVPATWDTDTISGWNPDSDDLRRRFVVTTQKYRIHDVTREEKMKDGTSSHRTSTNTQAVLRTRGQMLREGHTKADDGEHGK